MAGINEQLLSTLKSIKGNGSFVTSGTRKFVLPGLQIDGIGDIGFPIVVPQLKAIIKVARQAPFGQGSRTVTDTSVRRTWEIDAEQLTFANPDWAPFLEKTVKSVKKGLGIGRRSVTASLYKLLIYEEGGFFLPHQDSEKEPGMFGTLIIGLPAAHAGGELFVRFDDREALVDFAGVDPFSIPHVAFYADCEHEVKPVTAGYRVCLVYNLLQTGGGDTISGPQFSEQADQLREILEQMTADFTGKPKAILLGHQYTPANFSLDNLKQHDRPRAEALLAAAKEAQYFAQLGLLTHYQMGELEGADHYFDSRYSYRNSYSEPKPGYMGAVHEQYTHIEYWEENGVPGLGNLFIREQDILTDLQIGEGKPSEQAEEGFTGNAGMTIEYWYYYGAVILWPKCNHYDLLQERPIAVRLQWVDFYLKHWEDGALSSQKMVKQLLSTMVIDGKEPRKWNEPKADYNLIASALVQLKDQQFLKINGRPLLREKFESIEVNSWLDLLRQYSPAYFSKLFAKAGKSGKHDTVYHLLKILKKMRSQDRKRIQAFVAEQVGEIPDYLKKLKLYRLDDQPGYWKKEAERQKKTVTGIVKLILLLSQDMDKQKHWRKAIFERLTQPVTRTYVNEILVPILLKGKYDGYKLTRKLYAFSKAHLQTRVKAKPEQPSSWRRAVPDNKYHQDIWEILQPFLTSPTQQIFDYVRNESERKEMEYAIRDVDIDLKTETIRKGRPYTLRLTKTQAAYERALTEWEEDVVQLTAMKQMKEP